MAGKAWGLCCEGSKIVAPAVWRVVKEGPGRGGILKPRPKDKESQMQKCKNGRRFFSGDLEVPVLMAGQERL